MPEGRDTDRTGAERVDRATGAKKLKSWQDFHDPRRPFTEESVWQAIADAEGLDYNEIADGDLTEWL
jgi:hypothetical protein